MRLTQAIEFLKKGESFAYRGKGHSMEPYLKNNEKVWVYPINREIEIGDVVLCTVNGRNMEHFVKGMRRLRNGEIEYRIENSKGHVNGWTTRNKIYGFVVKYENQDGKAKD